VLRAVLDANILVSGLISPQGPPGQILRALFKERSFELVMSIPIIVELRRVLTYRHVRRYINANAEEIELWLSALALIADVTEGVLEIQAVVDDPADDKYLVAALEGRARFIVSGDTHLLDLGEYEGVRIVTARAFLQLLKFDPSKAQG
jgi:putative PIN family toxin of toxin-antitoxin system